MKAILNLVDDLPKDKNLPMLSGFLCMLRPTHENRQTAQNKKRN